MSAYNTQQVPVVDKGDYKSDNDCVYNGNESSYLQCFIHYLE